MPDIKDYWNQLGSKLLPSIPSSKREHQNVFVPKTRARHTVLLPFFPMRNYEKTNVLSIRNIFGSLMYLRSEKFNFNKIIVELTRDNDVVIYMRSFTISKYSIAHLDISVVWGISFMITKRNISALRHTELQSMQIYFPSSFSSLKKRYKLRGKGKMKEVVL